MFSGSWKVPPRRAAPCRGWPASGPGRLRLALDSDRSVRSGLQDQARLRVYVGRRLLPSLVALRAQSRLMLEGRIRMLSGPSPAVSLAVNLTRSSNVNLASIHRRNSDACLAVSAGEDLLDALHAGVVDLERLTGLDSHRLHDSSFLFGLSARQSCRDSRVKRLPAVQGGRRCPRRTRRHAPTVETPPTPRWRPWASHPPRLGRPVCYR